MLLLAGYALGRYASRRTRLIALGIVAFGAALVGLAIALVEVKAAVMASLTRTVT